MHVSQKSCSPYLVHRFEINAKKYKNIVADHFNIRRSEILTCVVY